MESCDKIISLALPRGFFHLLTYRLPEKWVPFVHLGGCVTVPFRSGTSHAFIVEPAKDISTLSPHLSIQQLKSILEIHPREWSIPKDVFELCKWAHTYYFAPLGEVLQCALPAALQKEKKKKRKKVLPSKNRNDFFSPLSPIVLTAEQNTVLEKLNQFRINPENPSQTVLLHGMTGSGKTILYIELAQKTLKEGKSILLLVPEIALTPQLQQCFETQLQQPVGLWHSTLTSQKKFQYQSALQSGELKVLIGVRSSVFAPIPNLGLIIVDEEHDSSYKQEERIRYNARDLAIVRGKLASCMVLLGSATPSLETRERIHEGRYQCVSLTTRIAPAGLPKIEWINLCEETLIKGLQFSLAYKTLEKIQTTLQAGEQILIYLNRRGFAAFLLCQDCGAVRGCPQCSISLTLYKKPSPRLCCHLCGYAEPIPHFCPQCSGRFLKAIGGGTESLETELSKLVPTAKITRLDRSHITSHSRLKQVLNDFRNHRFNVLVGTQMCVKGHDFPNVTLVIVMMADALFQWPDFRAPERALQVLTQVAGRAGRANKPGTVLVQTYNTQHPVLQVLDGKHSETSFLRTERELRKLLQYPPFGRLAKIRFSALKTEVAEKHAKAVMEHLTTHFSPSLEKTQTENLEEKLDILGPYEAFLAKVKNIYRWDILLKASHCKILHQALLLAQENCLQFKRPFLIDVDPIGF